MASTNGTPEGDPGLRQESANALKGRILLVDDEPALVRAYARILERDGYEVQAATDGVRARELVEGGGFDVVLTDVHLPGMSGFELLRLVRRMDPDLPVIMLTGSTNEDGAHDATATGAFFFLTKPIELRTLLQIVTYAARLHRLAKLERAAPASAGATEGEVEDLRALDTRFATALASIWVAHQPIVRWRSREVFGYEALMRHEEPTLRGPLALLRAAERLGRLDDVGRAVRERVAKSAAGAPDRARIFVNLHARDLADPWLLADDEPLSLIADRVVLEITERAPLGEVKDVAGRVAALRSMGFRIAIDDLGAGYADLTAFAQLKPDVVKLDMSLVRDVDREPVKAKIIAGLTSLCNEMEILVVAEGVETPAERDALAGVGCDLMQGYLFAEPARGFPAVVWQ